MNKNVAPQGKSGTARAVAWKKKQGVGTRERRPGFKGKEPIDSQVIFPLPPAARIEHHGDSLPIASTSALVNSNPAVVPDMNYVRKSIVDDGACTAYGRADDVERAACSAAEPPESNEPNIPEYDMTEAQEKYVEKHIRGGKTDEGKVKGHSHPVAALDRAWGEHKIFEIINARNVDNADIRILDVGGNPSRHKYAKRFNVWCLCPIISSQDSVRKANLSTRKDVHFCECRVERWISTGGHCCEKAEEFFGYSRDDQGVLKLNPPFAIVMVHSVYYLSQEIVNDLTWMCLMTYSLHHKFPDVKGQLLSSNAHYERKANGKIMMSVTGAICAYFHDNIDWIYKSTHYESDSLSYDPNERSVNRPAMAWASQTPQGASTDIVHFARSEKGLIVEPAVSYDPIMDYGLYGPVLDVRNQVVTTTRPLGFRWIDIREGINDGNPPWKRWIMSTFPSKSVYSVGSRLIIGESMEAIIVPKEAVAKVVIACYGKPRDESGWSHCMNEVKKLTNQYGLSPEQMAAALPFIAALGFTAGIENELRATRHVVRNSTRDRLNAANKDFKSEKGCCITVRTRVFSKPSLFLLVLFVVVFFLGGVTRCGASGIADENIRDSFVYFYYASLGALMTFYKYRPKQLPDFCNDGRELQSLAKGAGIDTNACVKITCEPGYSLSRIGVSFGPHPIYARQCPCNVLVSLHNRALKVQLDVDRGMWEDLTKLFFKSKNWKFLNRPVVQVDFVEWVARFPGPRKRLLEQAKLDVDSNDKSLILRRPYKAFLKIEKLNKSGPFDPRLIQGTDLSYQVLTGPNVYAVSKHVSKYWMNIELPVNYAAGFSAEELGEWFGKCNELGFNFSLEIDVSRFDAAIGVEALEFEFDVYRRLRMDAETLTCLRAQYKTTGWTKDGIRYWCKGTRKSGTNNTAIGNSLINAAVVIALCNYVNIGLMYRSLVMGDDMILMTTKENLIKLLNIVNMFYEGLGFSIKINSSLNGRQAEFCNGLFWPSGGKYYFGPKPGRLLGKTFYMLKNTIGRDPVGLVKGICLSLEYVCSYVPILRELIQHLLNLTHFRTAKYPPYEAHKFVAKEKHMYDSETIQFFVDRYECMPHWITKLILWIKRQKTIDFYLDDSPFECVQMLEAMRERDNE
jgi:hypothetical protein